MHGLVKDIRGQKFGKLTPLEYIGKSMWLCKCDCGNEAKVSSDNLKSKKRPTVSCGCIRSERCKKHGHSGLGWKSPTYKSWDCMKNRCLYTEERLKKYYNKEMLCKRWYKFENFLEDMGERPKDCEIHRIDSSKGYFPDNCEWKDRILHKKEHTGKYNRK